MNYIVSISNQTISHNKTGVLSFWPGRTVSGNGIFIKGKLVSRFFATEQEALAFLHSI
jgi:hypothetical protein